MSHPADDLFYRIVSFMATSFCVTGCDHIKEDAMGVAYARIRREMLTEFGWKP